jgi:hypothetical protein
MQHAGCQGHASTSHAGVLAVCGAEASERLKHLLHVLQLDNHLAKEQQRDAQYCSLNGLGEPPQKHRRARGTRACCWDVSSSRVAACTRRETTHSSARCTSWVNKS